MTKTPYKNIAIHLLNLSVIAGLALPAAFSLAARAPSATSTDKGDLVADTNYCSQITDKLAKIEADLARNIAKAQAQGDELNTQLQADRAAVRAQLTAQRTAEDNQLDQNIHQLEAKAMSDAKRQALLVFREAVSAAISARRTALDTAVKAFRDGVDKARIARKDAIKKAFSTFQSSVTSALNKAKANCAARTAPKTIQANLHQALKAARDKFTADKRTLDKFQDTLKPLIANRKLALTKAQSDFQAAIKKARADFKVAALDSSQATSTATSS